MIAIAVIGKGVKGVGNAVDRDCRPGEIIAGKLCGGKAEFVGDTRAISVTRRQWKILCEVRTSQFIRPRVNTAPHSPRNQRQTTKGLL